MNQKKHDNLTRKCLRDSEKNQVSVFLLMKQELNYRKTNLIQQQQLHNCFTCKQEEMVKFEKQRPQCKIIGISESKHADVDNLHICDEYKFQ